MTIIDHIAIRVPNVVLAADWYVEHVGGVITNQFAKILGLSRRTYG